MKKIALAAVIAVAASTAFAGNISEPMMDNTVIEAATSSSDGGLVVPLMLLVFLVAAAS